MKYIPESNTCLKTIKYKKAIKQNSQKRKFFSV